MTIAATSTLGAAGARPASRTRGVGFLTIATGIVGLALLAAHPGGDAKTFTDVLKNEAGQQIPNAIVHGGFIVVLALQMVCYAVFSARLRRATAAAGLVFFAIGTAFLCASLLLDGIVTPALAVRYLAKPDKIESARVLFVLIGTLVGFLMPIALAFQSAAIAAWGWALTASGARAAGAFGVVLGLVMVAAIAAGFVLGNPMALMGAIVGVSIWAVVAGQVLLRSA